MQDSNRTPTVLVFSKENSERKPLKLEWKRKKQFNLEKAVREAIELNRCADESFGFGIE